MSQIELNRAVQDADSQSDLLPSRRSSSSGCIGVALRPLMGAWPGKKIKNPVKVSAASLSHAFS